VFVQQALVAMFLKCLFHKKFICILCSKGGETSKDQQEKVEVSEHQSHETEEQHGEQAHQVYNLYVSNE
jgi:hypothetical protein